MPILLLSKRAIPMLLVASGMTAFHARSTEVGLLLDKQFGQSISLPNAGNFKSFDPSGFGIRGAYTLINLKVAELGLTATYHPKAKSDFASTFIGAQARSEYISVGAQADWKFLVNLHLGMEMRREKISTLGRLAVADIYSNLLIYANAGDTTISRPWINTGVGFSWPLPVVSPFVRLEAAYALKTYSLPATTANGDDLRKAIASKYQVAIYGGIRF